SVAKGMRSRPPQPQGKIFFFFFFYQNTPFFKKKKKFTPPPPPFCQAFSDKFFMFVQCDERPQKIFSPTHPNPFTNAPRCGILIYVPLRGGGVHHPLLGNR
ncbi:MAG: hypothetical protein FWD06_09260, partial [Oscillospiraceae bacterium]|nr:hypothetical protein [Oscillospiraceae bacterium]